MRKISMCVKLTVLLGFLSTGIALTSCSDPLVREESRVKTSTGGVNNGDPTLRDKRIAAFAGQESFTYCIEKGHDVPYSLEKLDDLLKTEVELWSVFIEDSGVNAHLRENGAPVLPTQVSESKNCAAADLALFAGTPEEGSKLYRQLLTERDSLLAGLFEVEVERELKSFQQAAWIAGEEKVLRAKTQRVAEGAVDFLDYSDEKKVAFTLRYIIGRLYGNVITPGTVLGTFPDFMMDCKVTEKTPNPPCAKMLEAKTIDHESLLVNTIRGGEVRIPGCLLGTEPAVLTLVGEDGDFMLVGDSLELRASWLKDKKSGKTIVANDMVQSIEVFAVDGQQRFFSNQNQFSGFSAHDIDGKIQLSGKERLSLNQGAGAVLTLEKPNSDQIVTLFHSNAECEKSGQSAKEKLLRL